MINIRKCILIIRCTCLSPKDKALFDKAASKSALTQYKVVLVWSESAFADGFLKSTFDSGLTNMVNNDNNMRTATLISYLGVSYASI